MRLTDLEPRWFDVPGVGGAIDGVSFLCPCAKCAARGDATHRCKVCGARWRLNPADPVRFPPPHPFSERTWSLQAPPQCGPCCDNAQMGDQIEMIPGRPRERIAVQFTPMGIDAVAARSGGALVVVPLPGRVWTRTGETFAALTLAPSIDASAAGHWHGFVTNGEIR